MIAGHLFVIGFEGRCSCGKVFQDIVGVQREHIGKDGWAHTSHLSAGEYDQIIAEKERIWGLIVIASTNTGAWTVEADPQPAYDPYDDAYFGASMA